MKTLLISLLSLFCLLSVTTAFAQEQITAVSVPQKTFSSSEEFTDSPEATLTEPTLTEPTFDGGYEALSRYLTANLKYPAAARRQGLEGTVILEYSISADGSVENIKVAQSLSPELDQEAIRLAQNMPKWNPALQNGQPSRIRFQLPVKFEINSDLK